MMLRDVRAFAEAHPEPPPAEAWAAFRAAILAPPPPPWPYDAPFSQPVAREDYPLAHLNAVP